MLRNEMVMLELNQLTNWGILATDAALTITGWNNWLEVHSQKPASELIGRNLFEVFPELITRRLDHFFRQALTGQVVLLSQRLHKYLIPMAPNADGAKLPHMQQSVRIAPLVDGGQVIGTITVIEDVTERYVYETELVLRTRRQAALASFSQRALAGGDIATLLHETAKATAELLGVECCAIWERDPNSSRLLLRAGVGWNEGQIGHASVAIGPPSHVGNTFVADRPGTFDSPHEKQPSRGDALLHELDIVSGISLPLRGGNAVLGVVGVYSKRQRNFSSDDVQFLQATSNVIGLAMERKRLETELREHATQLADADQRKDEFLAMLAHELRNPLAPIRNAIQVIGLVGTANPEIQYARKIVERQVTHLTRLVDDLLDVSRITRGKVNLLLEPVELVQVLNRAIEISRPLIDARNHVLTVTTPPHPLFVKADLTRLSQVVANLLNNAAKFTEHGGRINLIVEEDNNQAVLRVQDTGVGIAPEMRASIFDLFTQAQGSVSRSEGGLGIGLSLVRSLVEMHGGTVKVFSKGIGHGSEFEVRLPLLQETEYTAIGTVPHHEPGSQARVRHILVVDDNVDAAESLAVLLRLTGHNVRTAHDGHAALEAAKTSTPEIVLLDIGLPRMNGLEVARRMRDDLHLTKTFIVALTGYGQEEDRKRSLEAGFNAHLVKPLDLDVLQSILDSPGSR